MERVVRSEQDASDRQWRNPVVTTFYDALMHIAVFPYTLKGSMECHRAFLKFLYMEIHGQRILELGAGTGDSAGLLPLDNRYTGIDPSPGMLRAARRKLNRYGFHDAKLTVGRAEELPFPDSSFDIVLSHLSMNFFREPERAVTEAARVLGEGGRFIGSVPVSSRSSGSATIRGRLMDAEEWRNLIERRGFDFEPLDFINGVLFYFTGRRKRI